MNFSKLKLTSIAFFMMTAMTSIFAQSINWEASSQNKNNLLYLNLGYDFGMVTQLGFAYSISSFKPLLLTADYSFPMGANVFDDYKMRLGLQLPIIEKNNFKLAAGYHGVLRRQETRLVQFVNLGSEFSLTPGYYKSSWHIALRLAFDQAALTKATHGDQFKEYYPEATDAWYKGTAGHFKIGLEGTKTIGKNLELSLSLGVVNAKGKDQNPLLPYFAQLGAYWKFSSRAQQN